MLGYGQQAGGTHPTGMHSCVFHVLQQSKMSAANTWDLGIPSSLECHRGNQLTMAPSVFQIGNARFTNCAKSGVTKYLFKIFLI